MFVPSAIRRKNDYNLLEKGFDVHIVHSQILSTKFLQTAKEWIYREGDKPTASYKHAHDYETLTIQTQIRLPWSHVSQNLLTVMK